MPTRILAPDDPALAAYQQQINTPAFADLHLDIVPFAAYREALDKTLNAEQSDYEVVFVPGHLWIPELAAAGKLQSLDGLSADWAAYHADEVLSIVNDEAHYAGQRYMIPLFTDGHVLLYAPDCVDIRTDTVDVRQMRTLAANAQVPDGQHAIALKAHPSEIFLDWLPYLYAEGGCVLDDAMQPAFNTDAGRQALAHYLALRDYAPANTHDYDNAAIADALRQGTVTMAVTWGGQAAPIYLSDGSVAPDRYRVAALHTPWNATWGAAIPANQPATSQQTALTNLLRLNTPTLDVQVITAAGSPVRASSYSAENIAQYPWLAAQKHLLETAQLLPKHPQIGAVLGALFDNVYRAFRGEKTPSQALADAENAIQS